MKQVIILRKDLNMRKGKMAAQAAHASCVVVRQEFDNFTMDHGRYHEFRKWLDGEQTKIVVGVDSEEELFEIHSRAKEAGLPCSLILDAGHTEFDQPTYTAVALGPAEAYLIDQITGGLKLL